MDKKFIVNVVIHGFAIAHAITAATLAQTLVGDEVALTSLTIVMIVSICKIYGYEASVSSALAFLGVFAGFYLGTRGATFLVKWIPGIGNTANALSTVFTTEVLGWATYAVVSKGRKIEDVNKGEADALIAEGKRLKKQNEEEKKRINEIINKMSTVDKALYNEIIEELKSKEITDSHRDNLLQKLENLFQNYE